MFKSLEVTTESKMCSLLAYSVLLLCVLSPAFSAHDQRLVESVNQENMKIVLGMLSKIIPYTHTVVLSSSQLHSTNFSIFMVISVF